MPKCLSFPKEKLDRFLAYLIQNYISNNAENQKKKNGGERNARKLAWMSERHFHEFPA